MNPVRESRASFRSSPICPLDKRRPAPTPGGSRKWRFVGKHRWSIGKSTVSFLRPVLILEKSRTERVGLYNREHRLESKCSNFSATAIDYEAKSNISMKEWSSPRFIQHLFIIFVTLRGSATPTVEDCAQTPSFEGDTHFR